MDIVDPTISLILTLGSGKQRIIFFITYSLMSSGSVGHLSLIVFLRIMQARNLCICWLGSRFTTKYVRYLLNSSTVLKFSNCYYRIEILKRLFLLK